MYYSFFFLYCTIQHRTILLPVILYKDLRTYSWVNEWYLEYLLNLRSTKTVSHMKCWVYSSPYLPMCMGTLKKVACLWRTGRFWTGGLKFLEFLVTKEWGKWHRIRLSEKESKFFTMNRWNGRLSDVLLAQHWQYQYERISLKNIKLTKEKAFFHFLPVLHLFWDRAHTWLLPMGEKHTENNCFTSTYSRVHRVQWKLQLLY